MNKIKRIMAVMLALVMVLDYKLAAYMGRWGSARESTAG